MEPVVKTVQILLAAFSVPAIMVTHWTVMAGLAMVLYTLLLICMLLQNLNSVATLESILG